MDKTAKIIILILVAANLLLIIIRDRKIDKYKNYIKCTQEAANLQHKHTPDGHWYRRVKSMVKECMEKL